MHLRLKTEKMQVRVSTHPDPVTATINNLNTLTPCPHGDTSPLPTPPRLPHTPFQRSRPCPPAA